MGQDKSLSKVLAETFFPFASARSNELRDAKSRFVHYTSARVALSIIENSEVWLRNARVMNDFNEMRHGERCLVNVWQAGIGEQLTKRLDEFHSGLGEKLTRLLDQTRWNRQEHTYLLSLSEHGSSQIDEDRLGRLSMWRAYGGIENVALVLNQGPMLGDSQAYNAFVSPVLYGEEAELRKEFETVIERIDQSNQALAEIPGEKLIYSVLNAITFAILATKHPGFSEEREWRVLANPMLWPSDTLVEQRVIVGDLPQKIFKLPLRNFPERGLVGASVPEILDRIIIGPTQYPKIVFESFVDALRNAGVENAPERVIVSDIPLRR